MGISFLTEHCGVAVFGLDLGAALASHRWESISSACLLLATSCLQPSFHPPSTRRPSLLRATGGLGLVGADDMGLVDGLSDGLMLLRNAGRGELSRAPPGKVVMCLFSQSHWLQPRSG